MSRLAFDLVGANPAEALSVAQDGAKLAQKLGWRGRETRAYRTQALALQRLGDYTSAQIASNKAIKLAKEINYASELGSLYMEMAISFMDQNLYDIAEDNYLKAKKLFEEQQDTASIPRVLHNLANLYDKRGDREKAVELYEQNLVNFQQSGMTFGLAVTHNNLGRIYLEEGDYPQAEAAFLKAVELKKEANQRVSLVNSLNNLGELYCKTGQFDMARRYLEESDRVARQVHSRKPAIETLRHWADYFHALGRDDSAFHYMQMWVDRKDSLFNKETVERVAMLYTTFRKNSEEAQIALLQKDQEIQKAQNDQQEADLKRQRWFIAFLGIGLGLAFVLALVLFRSNQRHRRALSLLRDKNQEIQAQKREIEEQNKELENLNRETDGLINIVAHDLKAPLNRSTGLAQLIELTGPLTDEQKTYVEMIGKVNEAGSRLIQDLLDINHIEHPDSILEVGEVQVGEVFQGIFRGFEASANKKDIQINLDAPRSDLSVQTDEKFLERILDNLVSNALKFTEPGKNIYLGYWEDSEGVEISIRDEGPGISEEDQKKMFQKFQRLSARPTGGESSSGLGLAIVKALIRKLKGEIRVESRVGSGTEFRVLIPNLDPGKGFAAT